MVEGTVVDLLALAEIFIGVTIIAGGWLYILSWFYEAKRMMRWRPYAFAITIGFTTAMFFNTMGMITVVNGLTGFTNILFNLTVGSLLLTFAGIGMMARDIASLERLGVGLKHAEKVKFAMQPTMEVAEETGIPCIDALLQEKPARAPIVICGQDGTHAWRLGQRHIVTGLLKGEPCIYFTITRPPELIIEQLDDALEKHGKKLADFKNSFVIVDCFTPFAGLSEHETFLQPNDYKKAGWLYVEGDPQDLNSLHSAYRDARRLLQFKDNVRAVFDNFSGVMELADEQLLYQYLLHTLVAEEKFRYMSIYLIKREEHLETLRHLVSGVVKLSLEKGDRHIEIEKMPVRFKSGKFRLTDDDDIASTLKKPKPME